MPKSCKTIGVLISCFHEPYQARVWNGLAKYAKQKGIELISFVGTSQDNVNTLENHYYIVTDFIKRAKLDGLVCFGGAIENHRGTEFSEKLYNEFKGLPTILISSRTAGLPSVMVDNFNGVVAIVDHLVKDHGRKKIAFIKGPDGALEAEERFSAYKFGLQKNGLPFKNELVRPGQFMKEDGVNAIKTLMEDKVKFDAVIGADDFTALGAIEQLRNSGINVPMDVSVTGFDDESIASVTYPPLTTVGQPWNEFGKSAIDNLLNLINKKKVSDIISLKAPVYFRRSCGCFPATIDEDKKETDNIIDISLIKKQFVEKVLQNSEDYNISQKELTQKTASLLESFSNVSGYKKESGDHNFLNRLEILFDSMEKLQNGTDLLLEFLSTLQNQAEGIFTKVRDLNKANGLLQKGQSLLREYKLISLQASTIKDAVFQDQIRESCQGIITTFHQHELLSMIADKFPALHINRTIFAMYNYSGRMLTTENWEFPEKSKLLLSYDFENSIKIINPEDNLFDTKDIIPDNLRDSNKPANWIMMPLFFNTEHFGYIVFEHATGHPPFMFEELRTHIGSSIKSSSMMDELKIQSMMDELTGVQNRRGFMSRGKKLLEAARDAGKKTLVFYADLDKLKTINDTYGHEEGDAAIAGAADILKQTFRRNDVIGRIGGDEFCVIMAMDNANETGHAIMERLNQNITKINKILSKPYKVSLSVGTSVFKPDNNKSLDAILKEADDHLMEKKRARKKAERDALKKTTL
ncbi:MAG: GGDEF domain-containing protein [Deltaproteobacteria bacterium]|nr:GGDEF domain-containing protein [Deltaproteobacteria bacterium]